ncbi:NADP-dependent phosphogluconate dehydrogenase [Brachybacterium paraconglomeratum]|mgnify:CR=1 FL=1|uniref:6-phosphogluconate dehydrogenase, decarboxylating n=1 Tax=Brachybacterium paraconglomeratum TaxID=173362 RepID=A0A921KR10_9MICO|nr:MULTISPECIES: NADP-dependent phosphogluconate dehydrogenase [Brachybacterium]MCT1437336.1 NADP-dependent phosphogluconate dehydrogenase [Brachybacterium paraconglomeratum]OFT64364.1 phosphogluconate dehydrogenase (NADP(+)-dependent, decarboxylating) [Brachybacterium sp. HMSC06H03]WME23454.1 NADP-dependent phosphogluconate dehydrogenase [Brachybacterium sp. GU-2]HJF50304.1 NADP-dependent phosphogluconate dehydrogenase [Brachybacterium paraconglomeratum]
MASFAPSPADVADIGVTGMAVMGSNLARNFARNGFKVAIHNRSVGKTETVMDNYASEGEFYPSESMADFVASLQKPRVAIIMVKAGKPTDAVIDELASLMEEGDIIVDAGNALFGDTRRREAALREKGLHFVGSGVSGGEEGALNGPSIMPGGTKESYDRLGPMFEKISAHVDGVPCCTHVGADGAGHFVKMVHNGIEYADMQVISEAYDMMSKALGMGASEIGDVFAEWNKGDLESFLIEITAEVLHHTDQTSGKPFVDVILDRAAQKGTGAWTVQTALDLGVPVTGIAEATFARSTSGSTPQREAARGVLKAEAQTLEIADKAQFIDDLQKALYAAKLVSYSQGFDEIAAGAKEYGWDIDLGAMARIWRGGCIIRARFLNRITEAYERDANLPLLLADAYFTEEIAKCIPAWRRIVAFAAASGYPVPVFSSTLSYYDAVRAERLPAALVQAQRDYFGAHTYQRVDTEGTFHVEWTQDRRETKQD